MTTRSTARRWAIGAAAAALAVGGLQVATQQTAYAVAQWEGETGGNLDLDDNECAMVPGLVEQDKTIQLKKGANKVTFSGQARAEGPGPNDRVDMSGRATIKTFVKTSGQYLTRVDLDGRGKLDIRPTEGHNCDPDARLSGGAVSEFLVKHPGWIKLNGSTDGPVGLSALAIHQDNVNESATLSLGSPPFLRSASKGSASTEVSPGAMFIYMITTFTDEDQFGEGGIIFRKAAGDAKANATLTVIREGSAKGSAKGSGKKYAKPASQRKCSAGKLPITLTKKAKQAKKIEVYAGKKKVASYKGKPGTKKVKLPKKAATVKVVSKLKKGGQATVKRSYHACL